MMGKKFSIAILFLLTGMVLFAHSQEIDPFYQRILNEGEAQFKAKNYREAVKALKVAVFGIEGPDNILGKAHVYLGLSYFYLDQEKQSEEHLKKALDLIGTQGISEIDLSPKAKDHLSQLLQHFGMENLEPEKKRVSPPPQSEELKPEDSPKNRIKDLEKKIQESPEVTAPYYELTRFYLENNQTNKAKKTLEKLTRQHPLESRALHQLGLLHFKEREFKKAEPYFSRIFALAKSRQVSSEVLDSSRAHHILGFFYRGKKDKAYERAEELKLSLTQEKINRLDLDERDLRVLTEILAGKNNRTHS